eukprot:TRINITY_DN3207_c0_g1_i4.p1 TRINITY_DN3207_c0_g1~~TRINITY_DN3207_c0_g1_i4.p1  ORF type:complete len:357 (+),score=56.35 TRINITY_DN3207_c0_g1_i4:152-1222(+)
MCIRDSINAEYGGIRAAVMELLQSPPASGLMALEDEELETKLVAPEPSPQSGFYCVFGSRHQFYMCAFVYSVVFFMVVGLVVLVVQRDEQDEQQPEARWLYLHGVTQFLCWGVMIPFAAYWAMFMRHRTGWLDVHTTLMGSATILQIPAAILAYQAWSGVDDSNILYGLEFDPHARYGYVVFSLAFVQAALGTIVAGGPKFPFTRIRLARWYKIPPHVMRVIATIHGFHGKLLLLVAFGNVILGVWTISFSDSIKWLTNIPSAWGDTAVTFVCTCIAVMCSLCVYMYRIKSKRSPQQRDLQPEIHYAYGEPCEKQVGSGPSGVLSSSNQQRAQVYHLYHDSDDDEVAQPNLHDASS